MTDALHPVLTATASIGAVPPIEAVFFIPAIQKAEKKARSIFIQISLNPHNALPTLKQHRLKGIDGTP